MPAAGHQGAVVTLLHDGPVVEHHDVVGVTHGTEAVGNEQAGLSASVNA